MSAQHTKSPSLRGRLATLLVRAIVKHWPANDSAAMVKRARKVFGERRLLRFRPPVGMRIEEVRDGVCGEWLTPSELRLPDAVLLYFHGGGYVSCSPRTHRPISATLAQWIGCRAFSLEYRLAPEYPFPAAVEDAVAAWQWLTERGVKPGSIALAGDSAGGGLALATLVALRDRRLPLPACVVCISPLVDLTGDYVLTNPKSCAMFFPEDGLAFARIYLGGAPPQSLLASPLHADLKGFPPMLIQVADKELLFDDSVRLQEKATASGVDSRLHIYCGLPHDWHMFVGAVPEARQALNEIADFVREKLTTVFPA